MPLSDRRREKARRQFWVTSHCGVALLLSDRRCGVARNLLWRKAWMSFQTGLADIWRNRKGRRLPIHPQRPPSCGKRPWHSPFGDEGMAIGGLLDCLGPSAWSESVM